ncbi:HAD family phosphatase [Clostridium sartagoforme]|uniref:HAD family phosphatase n=1 Tax=Clostridium sartagoforme TaxID=84031 RepID=A0A4S2DI26_9CLOT|nr:Cof-type HAD-IIB family hydrolase [Clostridium sartagoforme]MBS5950127.1 HAD family phosphatase [Clostridium sp.]TGY41798.1 HAD family phosphatase [Clostridium sartagoforme]
MKIKLIALDLDGTLLDSNGIISNKTCDAIKEAIKKGIEIVPATGRNIGLICEEIKVIDGIRYAITSNGAAVIDLREERVIFSNFINSDILKRIIDLIKNYPIVIELYADGHAYVDKDVFDNPEKYNLNENQIHLMSYNHILIDNFFDLIDESKDINWIKCVEKINIPFLNEDIKKKVLKSLSNEFDELKITSSGKDNIEINISSANKGNGLEKLVNILGIRLEEVAAIGDNNNDIEMIERSGLGIAMGNAIDEIKNKADYVTVDNDKNGAAEAIIKILDNDIESISISNIN